MNQISMTYNLNRVTIDIPKPEDVENNYKTLGYRMALMMPDDYIWHILTSTESPSDLEERLGFATFTLEQAYRLQVEDPARDSDALKTGIRQELKLRVALLMGDLAWIKDMP